MTDLTWQTKRRIMHEVLTRTPAPPSEPAAEAAYRKMFQREVDSLPRGATMEIPSEIGVEGVDDY